MKQHDSVPRLGATEILKFVIAHVISAPNGWICSARRQHGDRHMTVMTLGWWWVARRSGTSRPRSALGEPSCKWEP